MSERIKEILETKFEKELFEASIQNLNDTGNKLRYNNFAYSIRELSRHFLYRLSPDENVKACSWFKELTENGKPTRKQRMKYAIQGGITEEILKRLNFDTKELDKEVTLIKKTIDSLSKYTHINEDTFDLKISKVDEMSQKVFMSLEILVDKIRMCRNNILEFLSELIEESLLEEIIFNNYENVDALARRYSINDSDINNYYISEISNDSIVVSVSGDINFILEYGSNSERREGDGHDINISFPFSTKIHFKITDEFPKSEFEVDEFGVNTEKWYS